MSHYQIKLVSEDEAFGTDIKIGVQLQDEAVTEVPDIPDCPDCPGAASPTSIDTVTWNGAYFNGGAEPNTPTGFTISFWADVAGSPPTNFLAAAPLRTQHFAFTDCHETPDAVYAGIQHYKYSATLATPFVAAPGVRYWMSIVIDLKYYPEWGLAGCVGTYGTGQDFFGALQTVPWGLTFALFAGGETVFARAVDTVNANITGSQNDPDLNPSVGYPFTIGYGDFLLCPIT